MAIPYEAVSPRLLDYVERLLSHIRTPLYRNAYVLVVNQIAVAGLGVVYWMIAARLYDPAVVGQNVALMSTLLALADLSELALKSAMVRFVPRAGARTPRLVLYTYGTILVAATLTVTVLFLVGNRFEPIAGWLGSAPVNVFLVIGTVAIWCILYVEDGVLVGMRQTLWVLVRNVAFSTSKLILLIIGVQFFYNQGVLVSWFLPTPFLVLLINGLIFWRFLPKHIAETQAQVSPFTKRQFVTSVAGDYTGSILAVTSARLLPLLVISLLGNSASAFFYQAWIIATPLYDITSNVASSFTVEASANLAQIGAYSRRIILHKARLVLPMAGGIFVGAPLILNLFGSAYARESTDLLRWLALATVPVILTTWYVSYSRVLNAVKGIFLTQASVAVITIGLSYLWLPVFGVAGVGMAYFASQTVVAVLVVISMVPRFLKRTDTAKMNAVASRNRLLRRADWRFLLPTPQPEKSVCFTDGLLAQSVTEISKKNVPSRTPTGNDCDLAVAANPDPSTLRAAFEALRTGGALYTEWATWRAGGAGGIRRRLLAAGFADVQLYWAYPNPVTPRFWLPMQSGKAPGQYLADHRFARDNFVHRLARTLLPPVLRLGLRTGWLPHLSAVAYKNTPHSPNVFGLIRSEWAQRSVQPTSDSLSFTVLTGGWHLYNKIICLVFDRSNPHPHWVVKLPRLPEGKKALQHETQILNRLGQSNDGAMPKMVVPRILFERELDAVPMFGQTALTGVPLDALVKRDTWREFALHLTEWQVALAKLSQSSACSTNSQQAVERLASNLERLSDYFLLEPVMISQTRHILSAVETVPLVCAHFDFAPWNVLQTAEGLAVLDWDSGNWDSLPLLDLVYALANLAFRLENTSDAARMAEIYQRLLDPRTEMGSTFQECLAHYANQMGLPSSQIASLRLLTWIQHSIFEREELVQEQDGRAPLERREQSVCIALWKAELEWQRRCMQAAPPEGR